MKQWINFLKICNSFHQPNLTKSDQIKKTKHEIRNLHPMNVILKQIVIKILLIKRWINKSNFIIHHIK